MTLVELLVTIGIVAILVAIILPTTFHFMERSKTAQCLMKMKQWNDLIGSYTADQGAYPAYASNDSPDAVIWFVALTSYKPVRDDIFCPQQKDGRNQCFAYNIYMGWERDNVDVSTKPYERVTPLMVSKPASTAILTDGGSGADQESDGTGTFIYYNIRKSSNIHSKHQGGANWLFCDGHAEWMTKERAIELGGPAGNAVPFVRPF